MTSTEAHHEIEALRTALTSGIWTPSGAETEAAHEALLSGINIDVTPAEALIAGTWVGGTEAPWDLPVGEGGSRLTRLMRAVADLLNTLAVDTTEGQRLDRELRQLLQEVDDRRPRRFLDRFRHTARTTTTQP
ncbi:hypothetical protein [Streptomyces sp. NPDC101455]|uniref:hypothetical protein n=1 Tax=Streptomyces sp. NPDC101455 TaxID=3366142 RepID=UPI003824E79E